jgi:hypothetical protein
MRAIIFVHRWLGVALCALFLLWFPSGIGMMYWDFPSVTPSDRLERSPVLDASSIAISLDDAYARSGVTTPPTDIRLNTFDRRPVYRFRVGRAETVVYADSGVRQGRASTEMVRRIAAAWTGQSAEAARVESVDAVDQWTVQGPLRNLRPLWKFSWPNGEQVYVSEATGEVVQYTTTLSRLGAYLGPIPHWLYFTPLRKHQTQWSTIVIWSSGVGTISALLGLVIGLWRYSPTKRYRLAGAPARIPYRGQKRWHTIFGLIFGLGAATWAFSGMLSMDPFPSASPQRRGSNTIADVLRGTPLVASFSARSPRAALVALGDPSVRELELAMFAGRPSYIATLGDGRTRIVPADGPPQDEFDRRAIGAIVSSVAASSGGADIGLLDRYDAYYLDRHHARPLPVIVAQFKDADRTRYYIDPKTARVVASYGAGHFVNRWLYHGLHSLDFPWLYAHRPAWDIVVIAFMLGGAALSVTSVILAWRVLRRYPADLR